jgi:poly(3-hydroxybutyrate) depolymerase
MGSLCRAAVVGAIALVATSLVATSGAARPGCLPPQASPSYSAMVMRALRARRDVWGEELLRSDVGVTSAGARRFLAPLLGAGAPGQRSLTHSGFYYLAMSMPEGEDGAGSVALHVADGSQIIADRIGGRTLAIRVGSEQYGSCLARLTTARLTEGWLPILQTQYVDGAGNHYEQESFAGRLPNRRRLASFVQIAAKARRGVVVRIAVAGGKTRTLRLKPGATGVLRVAWERDRSLRTLSAAAYNVARADTKAYWSERLAEDASVDVPDPQVMDAWRAALAQNLALSWRYSLGNPYEEFSFPESLDVAQVMAEWGEAPVSRLIINTSLTRKPTPYPNWRKGEKLLAAGVYYRLFRDRPYLDRLTPTLRLYVADVERQLARSPNGLLARERYSSDIADSVYGLHSQAIVWQGLGAVAAAWKDAGLAEDAQHARAVADQLARGLRAAVKTDQRRLGDGSLFVPIALGGHERPYQSLTETRLGSYWNLVMPYALASGLFRPGSAQAKGIFRYMRLHGSRLLGLVRAGAYALYGRRARFPVGGVDEVYGINVARFLADNSEADQLDLSLYGQLAAAMTPGTFVGGEAASIAPLHGAYLRSTYLPPNAASNAAFLTKLRLMLVHETRDAQGDPDGLQLAFATPRVWLKRGNRIAVERMPTSAGPVSFELQAQPTAVSATIDLPIERELPRVALRLRLPRNARIASVLVENQPYRRFDPKTSTIDLTGLQGTINLVATTAASPRGTPATGPRVRRLTIHYRANNHHPRAATLLLPGWYSPRNNPPLPLVISPHGRGVDGMTNARLWGALPARASFALISPDGQGRRLANLSWGYRGQIDDLARMPGILRRTLPWLQIDRRRIYAVGGSMGGQEALLLLARHPRLLAGVAAFDSVVDFPRQYRLLGGMTCAGACARAWAGPLGRGLQRLARKEVGGTPHQAPRAWAARSPITYAARLGKSCVPIQLWWSTVDRIVQDQRHQSAALFHKLRNANPNAPISAFIGHWRHSSKMKATSLLPLALETFGLLTEPPSPHPAVRILSPHPSAVATGVEPATGRDLGPCG